MLGISKSFAGPTILSMDPSTIERCVKWITMKLYPAVYSRYTMIRYTMYITSDVTTV
jgi:hypothetical protein